MDTLSSGNQYGIPWTKQESDAADLIGKAYRNKYTTSVNAIQKKIYELTFKTVDNNLIKEVISKMDSTHESLLKQEPPYLKDNEYQNLVDYHKPRKAAKKVSTHQKANKN